MERVKMPIYTYLCRDCGDVASEMHTIDTRNEPEPCEECGSIQRTIQLQPVSWSMGKQARMISDAECESKYGKDWRETPGSRRMAAGEPEKIYSFKTKG
jgi:putative FmdB family regulatory protein